jgi:hypothetical protein
VCVCVCVLLGMTSIKSRVLLRDLRFRCCRFLPANPRTYRSLDMSLDMRVDMMTCMRKREKARERERE